MLKDSFECAPLYPYNLFFPSFFITTAWKLEQGRPPHERKREQRKIASREGGALMHTPHAHAHAHAHPPGGLAFSCPQGSSIYAFCWLVSTAAWFFPYVISSPASKTRKANSQLGISNTHDARDPIRRHRHAAVPARRLGDVLVRVASARRRLLLLGRRLARQHCSSLLQHQRPR